MPLDTLSSSRFKKYMDKSRLKKYIHEKEKKSHNQRPYFCKSNYCPLVWSFYSCASARKIEQINKRYIRIVLNDYKSQYKTLLKKSNKSTMEVKRLSKPFLETFKTISNINPNYMKDIFTPKTDKSVRANGIFVKSHKTINYGDNNKTISEITIKH